MEQFILGFVFGIVCTLAYVYWATKRLMHKLQNEIVEELATAKKDAMYGVNVELENGIIYCYGEEDHQFICQGTTLAEIREGFKQRFPDRTGFLASGDAELLTKLRAEIAANKEKDLVNE